MKNLKKQLLAAIAMTLVASTALMSSTYAWFISNSEVKAETLTFTAEASNALLISEDGTKWGTTVNLTDNHSGEGTNKDDTKLVPVSSIVGVKGTVAGFFKDEGTWVDDGGDAKAQTFVAATEKIDYYKETIYLKSNRGGSGLYFNDGTEFSVNAGGKADVLKTLRVAFAVTDFTNSSAKNTYLYQIDAANILKNYDTTFTDADGLAEAIKAAGTIAGPDDKASVVGNITADNLSSGIVVLNTVTASKGQKLFDFANPNDVCKIDIYVWIEGCDHDTNADIAADLENAANAISAKFAFEADFS